MSASAMSSNDIFAVTGSLAAALGSRSARAVLFQRSTSSDAEVRATTAALIESVRETGDIALREQAARFDGVRLDDIEVPPAALTRALNSLPPELRRVMARAAENIAHVHAAFIPSEQRAEPEPGILVRRIPQPLRRVGVYAPGGRAAYPSSVLMGAIPARTAGVPEVILCAPPSSDGRPPNPVLAAAALAGVDRVFAVGGAGAIAAMAFGTNTIPRVDKIVGPGNAYVAEAKLQLSGFVAFDSPAGPSELLIVADDAATPAVLAREVLAQAEHDPRATVGIVLTSQTLADQVLTCLRADLANSPRHGIIRAALRAQGALLWCDSLEEAIEFACEFAPEHLLLATRRPGEIVAQVRNAGTVFLGEYSSVAFGDYMTGANHVLPTGSLARSYSGLSTGDFMRWTTVQTVSREAASKLAGDVAVFARAEGLPAHAGAAQSWAGPAT